MISKEEKEKMIESLVAEASGEKRNFYRDTRLEAFALPVMGPGITQYPPKFARLDSGEIVQYTFSHEPSELLSEGLTSTFLGRGVALAPTDPDWELGQIAAALKSVPGVLSCKVEKRQVILVTTVAKDLIARDGVYYKEQEIQVRHPGLNIDFRVISPDTGGDPE